MRPYDYSKPGLVTGVRKAMDKETDTAALEKHGRHDEHCQFLTTRDDDDNPGDCTCGFSEALK